MPWDSWSSALTWDVFVSLSSFPVVLLNFLPSPILSSWFKTEVTHLFSCDLDYLLFFIPVSSIAAPLLFHCSLFTYTAAERFCHVCSYIYRASGGLWYLIQSLIARMYWPILFSVVCRCSAYFWHSLGVVFFSSQIQSELLSLGAASLLCDSGCLWAPAVWKGFLQSFHMNSTAALSRTAACWDPAGTSSP